MAAAFAVLIKARKKREQQRESAAVMNGGSSNDGGGGSSSETQRVDAAQRTSKDRKASGTNLLPRQELALWLYHTDAVQFFVAGVILFNFFAIVVEKEIDPYSADSGLQQYSHVWTTIDDICNVIFLIELILNLYGSWWRPFLRSGWNYLDTIVVVVGITSLARVPLGPLAQIKIIRAFRILRLFKRVDSLNQILIALVRSIPGVFNAFLVMLIVMMIFAIVAVDLFRDFGHTGEYTTVQMYGEGDATFGEGAHMVWSPELPYVQNTTVISSMTPRGFHYGQEYYGTFFRSLYTLFQVLTGESWSEAVVRPLLFGYASNALVVGIFFTVYILLTQVVLQNVVVAVLLDKFVEEPPKKDDENADEDEPADTAGASGGRKSATAGAPGMPASLVARVDIEPPGGAGASGGAGSSSPRVAAAAMRSAADEAVLAEAQRLGVRAHDFSRTGRGLAVSNGSKSSEAELVRLRGDVDTLLSEQALIRSHLHVILTRLDALVPPEKRSREGDALAA